MVILQILWNSSCLDSLHFSFHNDLSSAVVHDPAWLATVRSLYQKTVRDWIVISLSQAPCTSQGLLQVNFLLNKCVALFKHFMYFTCLFFLFSLAIKSYGFFYVLIDTCLHVHLLFVLPTILFDVQLLPDIRLYIYVPMPLLGCPCTKTIFTLDAQVH